MSASINKVILIGNLGKDVELRQAGSSPVADLRLATTRRFKDKLGELREETEWHTVTAWGRTAENCAKYLSKGRPVYVEGYLKTDTYEKDGVTRYSTKIVADAVQFLGGKSQQSEAPTTFDESDDIPF